MEEKIKNLINSALDRLDIAERNFVVGHPEEMKNGDYYTNVAMVSGKKLRMNPKELAAKIVEILNISARQTEEIEKIEVAGAGFINFYLSSKFFTDGVKEILLNKDYGQNNVLRGKKLMIEYTDPNPFKPFHIGHLMTNAIGESLARILENSGGEAIRVNYQGDVGLHVAKAIYGMYKAGPPADESAPVSVLAEYIGDCYAKGSEAYDSDPAAKKEIDDFNKKIYDKSDPGVNQVYNWGRRVTLEAFEEIYKILGTRFRHYFFESEMAPIGEKIVLENILKVFEGSDGAMVFKAEKYDPKLHTRVFITSQGLPTYETKELGLTKSKFEKENLDASIVITAHEQGEYMKVVQKAISLIYPEYEKKMKHITHGMMRFASGKMSSRKGNVITGESLIRDTVALLREKITDRELGESEKKEISEIVGVAAIKYSILRSKIGGDIVFDVDQSISVEGDSGPYLQYALIRAKSVLEKAKSENVFSKLGDSAGNFEKMLLRFPEVALRAYQELEPHHVVTYLTEIASAFNSFYAKEQIVDVKDPNSSHKVALTEAFTTVMNNGLNLLGIKVPEKM